MYRVLTAVYPGEKQDLKINPTFLKARPEKKSEGFLRHRGEREMFVEALDTREHRAIRQVERMYVVDAAERFGVKAAHAPGQV